MILAKVTDKLLFAADMDTMKDWYNKLTKSIKVSKTLLDEIIDFNGSRIVEDDEGNITMNMNQYLHGIRCMEITRGRRN